MQNSPFTPRKHLYAQLASSHGTRVKCRHGGDGMMVGLTDLTGPSNVNNSMNLSVNLHQRQEMDRKEGARALKSFFHREDAQPHVDSTLLTP